MFSKLQSSKTLVITADAGSFILPTIVGRELNIALKLLRHGRWQAVRNANTVHNWVNYWSDNIRVRCGQAVCFSLNWAERGVTKHEALERLLQHV